MAEFCEVMRQAQRMCKYFEFECGNCPLCFNNGCSLPPWKGKAGDEIERRVMDWATEHPEPQYPTWKEWLEEQCVISDVGWFEKGYKPIPADIAEKLGLKPKEAKD